MRWRNRSTEPLVVFISGGGVPGYSEDLRSAVREAFVRWERVGAIPVVFSFVRDSTQAEVVVKWVESFAIRRTGQAEVKWDPNGWLVGGLLTIATHQNDGRAVSREVAYTVALHEIGHCLGLGHIENRQAIMFNTFFTNYPKRALHADDINALRGLYAEPPRCALLALNGKYVTAAGGSLSATSTTKGDYEIFSVFTLLPMARMRLASSPWLLFRSAARRLSASASRVRSST